MRAFAHSSFIIWIGPLSLVQGLESAAGYLSPLLGALGRAGCCGTRLGVLRGWMDYTADGAVRPRPPDSKIRLAG